jgi:class 3 adenylate cyclase
VIKAFNNIYARHLLELGRPKGTAGRIALPVSGDDEAAKAVVLKLVDELGFDGVDAGGLDESWRQQPGTPVYTKDFGLEKIKTIGDGYMAAGGLLQEVKDPIGSAVRCGLEMASTLIEVQLGWEVRVGVHSGPVVAGVVGQERYQFDIWGDTVNVAARMSDKSISRSVAVTKDVWEHVGHDFTMKRLANWKSK